MATQTLVIGVVGDDSGQARLEVDIDDTTDPLDSTLVALRAVNTMSRDAFIDIRRGAGVSFWTILIPAGQTVSKNPGGPVRKESDIPFMLLRTT